MALGKKTLRWPFFLVGLVLGVGLLAGTSWVFAATDQRTFCNTCHIMESAAVSQKLSTHANLSCNDCHLPNGDFIGHYASKAYTGLYDVASNTLGWYDDLPIEASADMKTIINDNCHRCHTMTNINVDSMMVKDFCTDCHRNVPHMRTKPISTRMVAYE